MEMKARWRAVAAAALVVVGSVVVAPSFDFDSDNDGVVDSVEVYEVGSDPSSADTFGKQIVADRQGRG